MNALQQALIKVDLANEKSAKSPEEQLLNELTELEHRFPEVKIDPLDKTFYIVLVKTGATVKDRIDFLNTVKSRYSTV
jgi:hypothetical protein